jgi:nucleoside-diphosphate-sugar epimerase
MKFLITGGNGYLARGLTSYLLSLNHSVYQLNKDYGKNLSKYYLIIPDKNPLFLDDFSILHEFKFDGIFHLATKYSTNYDLNSSRQLNEVSVRLTESLGKIAQKNRKPLVVAGSYLQDQCNKLNSNLALYSSYKNIGEILLKIISKNDLTFAVTRQFESYGEFDPRNRILNRIIDSILLDKEFELDNYNFSLDFLHISDISKAYYSIFTELNSGILDKNKYLISSGNLIPIKTLVEAIEGISGKTAKCIILGKSFIENNLSITSSDSSVPVNWIPERNLSDDLKSIIFNRQAMLRDNFKLGKHSSNVET